MVDSFCSQSIDIWKFIGQVLNIMKIVIPIIIVLLGTIDLGKAVMAGEEKEITAAQKILIKRIIYGVIIFFLPLLVHIIFETTENDLIEGDSKICWECLTNVNGEKCVNYLNQ